MSKTTFNSKTLEEQISNITARYLNDISGDNNCDIYQRLTDILDTTVITTTLKYTNYNQKEAATILGISRNTLRRKITLLQIKI